MEGGSELGVNTSFKLASRLVRSSTTRANYTS
jgi:hypothetical protein